MYRNAASRVRNIKDLAGLRYLRSSVARKNFSSYLTGESSTSLPPLDCPLPGVAVASPVPDYVEPGKTQITTLPNGIRIASETSQNPVASIGLYVGCGSVYETPPTFGASHLLEGMAFKTTKHRSRLDVIRRVEDIGGMVSASASREQMGYTFDGLKSYIPQMLELLVDSVRNPVFLDLEVNKQLKKVIAETREISPQGLLMEAIHSVGYSGALANPLLAPEAAVSKLNSSVLKEFIEKNYTASRILLAAYGVDHEELVNLAKPLLEDMDEVPHPQEPTSLYTGGDYRCQSDSAITHVALAFEVSGGWMTEKDTMTISVLQMLMGGGDSFSAWSIGKGIHSRLYLRVLNQYQDMQSCSAFKTLYNNTGIFGIYAAYDSTKIKEAVDVIAEELIDLEVMLSKIVTEKELGRTDCTEEDLDRAKKELDRAEKELDRARQLTKTAVLMNLESRNVVSEDIGRQILTCNKRIPVEHFLTTVDKVGLEDIRNVLRKMLSSPLTMASWGDVSNVPSYEYVARRFKA